VYNFDGVTRNTGNTKLQSKELWDWFVGYTYRLCPKTSNFFMFRITLSKLTDFNDFWCVKSWENLTSAVCTFAHLTCMLQLLYLGKSKKPFSTVLFIHTYFGLFTLSQKKTNCYPFTHHTWKTSPHYLVKYKTFHLTEGNVAFHHALLKSSPCRNKTLPQLVRIVDWYSTQALLHHPNSTVPTSSSLSLEQ